MKWEGAYTQWGCLTLWSISPKKSIKNKMFQTYVAEEDEEEE